MADPIVSVDGIAVAKPASVPPPKAPKAATPVGTMKMILIALGAMLYVGYGLICFTLMATLPSPTGGSQDLVQVGFMVALLGGIVFAGIGAFGFFRIASSKAVPQIRSRALVKLGASVIPGLALSIAMPLAIMRQPTFTLAITSPTSADQMIAPLSMTFSFEEVVNNLKQQGFTPLKYAWDINGDKKTDQETLVPTLTARFEKSGVYAVSMVAMGANGQNKTASRRFVISQSVFTVEPEVPLVSRPVVFSLSNLLGQKDQIQSVTWDFDNDGKADETTTDPQITRTFFRTETVVVRARVLLKNNTEALYERSISIQEPEPLPFPVTLVSAPKNLLGNAPFPTLFRIDTKEPTTQVLWTFGDGERGEGNSVAHTFATTGNFVVTAKVYSQSGSVADLSTIVQVVERLDLSNLTFEGSPVPSGAQINAEVPLTLNLTPKTTTPFVQFLWEAPEATEVGSTDTTLQATYRREGQYTVTLVAKNAENKVLRFPITVNISPAKELVTFAMDPLTGVAPLNVRFDASETVIPNETISGFQWRFGDRSPEQYTGARTEHVYTSPGTYVIELTAKTNSGKDFRATKTIVVREPLVKACILPSRLSGPAPLGIQFSGECSTGDNLTYLWDFGDASQSDQEAPIHAYNDPGTYTATLRVTDPTGITDDVSVTITVQ